MIDIEYEPFEVVHTARTLLPPIWLIAADFQDFRLQLKLLSYLPTYIFYANCVAVIKNEHVTHRGLV